MKRSRFSEELIIAISKEAEADPVKTRIPNLDPNAVSTPRGLPPVPESKPPATRSELDYVLTLARVFDTWDWATLTQLTADGRVYHFGHQNDSNAYIMKDMMNDRTQFLAQLLGLYCLIIAMGMMTQKKVMLQIISGLFQSRTTLFVVGIFGVLGGLAMVLWHNVWSGGILALVVTLVGWGTLVKSAALLFVSPPAWFKLLKAIHYEQNYYLFVAINFVLGLYLTIAGFAK
jgi:hypothetical protein